MVGRLMASIIAGGWIVAGVLMGRRRDTRRSTLLWRLVAEVSRRRFLCRVLFRFRWVRVRLVGCRLGCRCALRWRLVALAPVPQCRPVAGCRCALVAAE